MSLTLAACMLVATVVAACLPSKPAKKDRGRTGRAEFQPPPGTTWQKAVLETRYLPGGGGRHDSLPANQAVAVTLRLTRNGKETKHMLGYFEYPAAEFTALRWKNAEARQAPDGHALLISYDGGAEWTYLGLDTPEDPLYCPHTKIKPAKSTDDPFAGAPTTRQLVIAILGDAGKKPGPGAPHKERGGAYEELDAAVVYAKAHLDDPEMRAAVIDAVVRVPADVRHLRESDEQLVRVAALAARQDEAGRDRLLTAFEAATGEHRHYLVLTLGRTRDEHVQKAMSAALAHPIDELDAVRLSWALQALTRARRSASPPMVAQLSKLAASHAAALVRINAIRALGVIRTPAVRSTLKKIAEGCNKPPDYDMDSVYDDPDHGLNFRVAPACWAREAYRRNQASRDAPATSR